MSKTPLKESNSTTAEIFSLWKNLNEYKITYSFHVNPGASFWFFTQYYITVTSYISFDETGYEQLTSKCVDVIAELW